MIENRDIALMRDRRPLQHPFDKGMKNRRQELIIFEK